MPKSRKELIPLDLLRTALTKPPKLSLDAPPPEPGEHTLYGVAAIAFQVVVSKAPPGTSRPRYTPDWPRVLAALLSREISPMSCQQAAQAVSAALKQAHGQKPLPAGVLEHVAQAVEEFIGARTAEGEERPKEGATHVRGTIEVLSWQPAAALAAAAG